MKWPIVARLLAALLAALAGALLENQQPFVGELGLMHVPAPPYVDLRKPCGSSLKLELGQVSKDPAFPSASGK